ncbi:MAG: biotin/lipoic acid binding domain-containing protein [candidate division NC10 bacterium CSP1-5]|nr:MAG: biotin/lipoic acid binding domain-containing protein [candidate division NC10 bacterium CSP1-5]
MEFFARIGDKEHRIEVTDLEGSHYRLSVDGVARDVDCVRISESCYSLILDGTSYEVDIIRGVNPYAVWVKGEVHDVEVLTEREKRLKAVTRKAAAAQEGRQVITAPMPSKVVRLLVAVGEQVNPGNGVIVVEAMKMENELRSTGAGTVREIRVKEGEAVVGGHPLVIIE